MLVILDDCWRCSKSSTTASNEKEYLCHGRTLSALSHIIYNIFCNTRKSTELWEALNIKYRFKDVGVTPQSQGVLFFFFTIVQSLSRQNTSFVRAQPWCASLVVRARPSLSCTHGLLCHDATQRHIVATEHLCRARLAWLRCNALPYCRDIERYVATWKTPCPRTFCHNGGFTLLRHKLRQLFRDVNSLGHRPKLDRDKKILRRDLKSPV